MAPVHAVDRECRRDMRLSPATLVCVLSITWAVTFSAYSSFLHEYFRSSSLDMALHSQILWNLWQGRFMQTSFLSYSFAGNHFWPGLYLLAPIYHWFHIHGVLALQSFVVSSGAITSYLLAKDITKSERWGLSLALAYLLQPTISIGVLFDFHLELFSIPCALFALLGLRRRKAWFWPFMLLSWAFYEVNILVWIMLGLALSLSRHRRITGGLIFASGFTYMCAVYFLIMPYFRGITDASLPCWGRYSHLGENILEAVCTIVIHPISSLTKSISFSEIKGLRYLFAAFGFLSFFSIKHFLPALPLLIALLLSNWSVTSDIRYGYVAPIIPFIVLSAAHGAAALNMRGLAQKWRLTTRGPIIVMVISIFIFFYFQIKKPFRKHPFEIRCNIAELRLAKGMIADGVSLSADNHLGAHFANRRILVVTPSTRYGDQSVEFVFADLNETEFKDNEWWDSMKQLIKGEHYGPVFFTNDVLLLKRGIINPVLAEQAVGRIIEMERLYKMAK